MESGDSSNHLSIIKEFNPTGCDLRPIIRQSQPLHDEASKEEEEEELKNELIDDRAGSNLKSSLQQKSVNPVDVAHELGTSYMQMKSLMKSISNGNFEYYQNLHQKYFEKAKDKSIISKEEAPLVSSDHDKSDHNVLSLSSKTGTILGLS